MNLTHKQLMQKLKALHMVSATNEPVTFPAFKNRAMIHKYGNSYKIVFIGIPAKSLFGFYVMYDNDMNVMREAYAMFLKLVKGNMEDYENKDVQWGLRVPVSYGNLRQR